MKTTAGQQQFANNFSSFYGQAAIAHAQRYRRWLKNIIIAAVVQLFDFFSTEGSKTWYESRWNVYKTEVISHMSDKNVDTIIQLNYVSEFPIT